MGNVVNPQRRFAIVVFSLAVVMSALALSRPDLQAQQGDEECNCSEEQQCAVGTCCFSDGFCTPQNKLCKVTEVGDHHHCEAGAFCIYNGEDCDGGGPPI